MWVRSPMRTQYADGSAAMRAVGTRGVGPLQRLGGVALEPCPSTQKSNPSWTVTSNPPRARGRPEPRAVGGDRRFVTTGWPASAASEARLGREVA